MPPHTQTHFFKYFFKVDFPEMSRCPLIIVDLPLKAIVMEIICLILRDLPLYQA